MTINDIKTLAETPFEKYENKPRVEIFVLHHSLPENTSKCISSIVYHTTWPYKLTVLDTSMYPAFLAKIYNKLINQSECEYVSIVCSDTVLVSNWLDSMMSHMLSIEDMSTIGPLTINHVNEEMDALRPNSGLKKVFWEWASLPIVLHKKKALDSIGGYNDKFFLYKHDPDLLKRLSENGYGIYVDTDIVAEHKGGSTTKKVFSQDDINIIEEYNNTVR